MKILGILLVVLSIIFLLHGSVKMADAQSQEPSTVELGEGIVLVEETESEQFSKYSLTIGGVLLVGGVLLLFISSRKNNS